MSKDTSAETTALTAFVPEKIWTKDYPIRYGGCTFFGRMTIIKLANGKLLIHSPCNIDESLKAEIEKLGGSVGYIVAPGTYHHLHVPSCQKAFPSAETYICPGLEKKRPDIKYDGILGDHDSVNEAWANEMDQVLIKGNRVISEVAFFHRATSTLILVDVLEYIGDRTPGTNWLLRCWWKYIMCMWNRPKPAPEYQMGWKDKKVARESMNQILDWDFDKVIIAHGENIEKDAKKLVRQAWKGILDQK